MAGARRGPCTARAQVSRGGARGLPLPAGAGSMSSAVSLFDAHERRLIRDSLHGAEKVIVVVGGAGQRLPDDGINLSIELASAARCARVPALA